VISIMSHCTVSQHKLSSHRFKKKIFFLSYNENRLNSLTTQFLHACIKRSLDVLLCCFYALASSLFFFFEYSFYSLCNNMKLFCFLVCVIFVVSQSQMFFSRFFLIICGAVCLWFLEIKSIFFNKKK